MATPEETVSIVSRDSDIIVSMETADGNALFNARSISTTKGGEALVVHIDTTPERARGEYVITLQFDTESDRPEQDHPEVERATVRSSLARLILRVKNLSVRIRPDGYELLGNLTGWVAYTGAIPRPIG